MKISYVTDPVDVDLGVIDLFDPDFYAHGDPHPVWKVMRDKAPVHRQTLTDGRSFLSVTRHADVLAVLKDHTRFTSRRGTLLSILGGTDPAAGKMLAASDPPVHTAMREPMMKVFSFSALKSTQPQILSVVHRFLAPLASGKPWDLAAAAAGFPMAFAGALMGLPEEDWPRLTRLSTMAAAPDDSVFGAEEGGHHNLLSAHHELFAYFADQVRDRGVERDDLIGFLTRMDAGGRRLRTDEIVYNCYSMLLGANVTMPHAIAATVLALMENPGEYALLTGESAQTALAVEEGLRWASPANHFMRYAVRDAVLSGVPIKTGEAVVAWLGSANRDGSVFADPYRFDVQRHPNRHVTFGFGPHYCIGAPLARIALRLLFGEIVQLVASFEPAGPVRHLASNFVSGVKSLPVTAALRDGASAPLTSAVADGGRLPSLPTA
ncbi:cytochrome P450 [Streptomyces sp. NRRL WC-3618]|uniref:cytochrome P450 n=1 Tax=Streptomyces sp. NRRL WC-3618 TaxID=1519490 RepID=UPI0006AD8D43|nr:cytochrome P450 [Streptomyces sp. NRRL WC-3618]